MYIVLTWRQIQIMSNHIDLYKQNVNINNKAGKESESESDSLYSFSIRSRIF